MNAQNLANLASLMALTFEAAVMLPGAIGVCASKVGMSDDAFAQELLNNLPLRCYVAEVLKGIKL